MLLNCSVGEDSCESLDCNEIQPVHPKGGQSWVFWCWSWKSNSLATSCEELTHWKRLWCREGLRAGAEGDDRGWDDWMASWTHWTWVSVNSGWWCWTGMPGVLQFLGLQRVRHNWATELNWGRSCGMWDLVPWPAMLGNTESYPLDHQGSPLTIHFLKLLFKKNIWIGV